VGSGGFGSGGVGGFGGGGGGAGVGGGGGGVGGGGVGVGDGFGGFGFVGGSGLGLLPEGAGAVGVDGVVGAGFETIGTGRFVRGVTRGFGFVGGCACGFVGMWTTGGAAGPPFPATASPGSGIDAAMRGMRTCSAPAMGSTVARAITKTTAAGASRSGTQAMRTFPIIWSFSDAYRVRAAVTTMRFFPALFAS